VFPTFNRVRIIDWISRMPKAKQCDLCRELATNVLSCSKRYFSCKKHFAQIFEKMWEENEGAPYDLFSGGYWDNRGVAVKETKGI